MAKPWKLAITRNLGSFPISGSWFISAHKGLQQITTWQITWNSLFLERAVLWAHGKNHIFSHGFKQSHLVSVRPVRIISLNLDNALTMVVIIHMYFIMKNNRFMQMEAADLIRSPIGPAAASLTERLSVLMKTQFLPYLETTFWRLGHLLDTLSAWLTTTANIWLSSVPQIAQV